MYTIEKLKDLIDESLPTEDGFESYIFSVESYNKSVSEDFKLNMDSDAAGVVILSTPMMFDVSFKRWFREKLEQLGSLDAIAEEVSSPIQEFMNFRLSEVEQKLEVPYELYHDYSMTPARRPKILVQTCGHVSGAAYYYQPKHVQKEDWPPEGRMDAKLKFIGLSLHPIYGGHFAFRSVFLFPTVKITFKPIIPKSILSTDEEIRMALEKFNYSWKDSGFRDFGAPKRRYSDVQVNFFGKPPADRWEVLREWC
ncbi:unnamed protein product [Auanema sp. JU1783]|nr:unnamed protein product [Auanema sp. JU1783]